MEKKDKDQISKELKTTFFARYFASRRFQSLNNLSLTTLTVAATTLIFSGLTVKYLNCTSCKSEIFELHQIVGAIITLTLSLIISFAEFSLKSEKMRNSADKISKIHKKMRVLNEDNDPDDKLFNQLYKKYQKIVAGENHSQWDYYNGRIERKIQEGEKIEGNDFGVEFWLKVKNNKLKGLLTLTVIYFVTTSSAIIWNCVI